MKKMFAMLLCAMLLFSVSAMAETKTVGVIQFAAHPSLDNCYTGFQLGLEEGGYVQGDTVEIDFQNAMTDMANSDMQAKNMAAKSMDMLVGIATPAAMSAYAATKDQGTPVVFVAVSDAVAAGIVQSNEAPGTNCTGVSDVLNLEEQVKMIRAFLPDATTIGVLYTTSEPNSIAHLARLEEIAPAYDFAVEAIGITNASEVAGAAASLVAKGVDCVNNFTDNNVVDNLSLVLHATDEAGIPVFGSEVEQVVNGCLATQGIDYIELGRAAGQMAAQILDGEAEPATMPVMLIDDVTPAYNSQKAELLGIALPEAYADAEDVAAE
ncbi:ABC transporter substrate-binding protein [Eubacteriales bacterium OttesenSCG-928-A19]|nr:ABC transporter substrate-binding protein [Eubacteriales bacterium OttesenSCG-928-A19]